MVFIFRKFSIVQYPNVIFSRNVRLQTILGVKAECPNAYIYLGDDCIIYEYAQLQAYGTGEIHIGAESILGDVMIYARKKITLGKRVLVSWNVMLQDYNPHPVHQVDRRQQVEEMVRKFSPRFRPIENNNTHTSDFKMNDFASEEIYIGDDVWLGANSIVLKGAHIEEGCIVSAGSVVYKGHYPARSLILGNPAKVVKNLDPTSTNIKLGNQRQSVEP
jgi:acetyltransferase-like isoleucine patch superfamily enzyme